MKVENLPRFINEFNKQVKTIESLTAERDKMKAERDELKTELKAAVQLCRIYFNIACELGGEETVRHKRDNAIKEIQEADK